jgi:hypothetical protein
VAIGAGDGVTLLDESLTVTLPRLDDRPLGLGRQIPDATLGPHDGIRGGLVIPAAYDGRAWTLAALALGVAGVPTGSGPYVHTFRLGAAGPSGYGTLILDKQVGSNPVWEYDTLYGDAWTLAAEFGPEAEDPRALVALECWARRLNRASPFNGATQAQAITEPAAPFLVWPHATVRLNAQASGALGSADQIAVRRFAVTVRNFLEPDHVTDGSPYAAEPAPTDYTAITGFLEFPEYVIDSPGVSEFLAGTWMKLDAVWQRDASHIVRVELPAIQLLAGEWPVDRSALARGDESSWGLIPFRAYEPATTPAGMTAADAIQVQLTNAVATDYLA